MFEILGRNIEMKKKYLNFFFILFILILVIPLYKENNNMIVLMSNFTILLLSLLFMFVGDKYIFSLNKIFMFFVFFFFGVAPLLQYQRGITLWWGNAFSDRDYILQNILIVLIIFFYQVIYFITSHLKPNLIETRRVIKTNKPKYISRKSIIILASFSLVITFLFHKSNPVSLFFRSDEASVASQPVYLIYSYFIRPLPIILLVFFKQYKVKDKKIEFYLILSSLLTNFPLATPRFYAAAMYIPLLLIYYKSLQSNYMKLNRVLIYGLMFVFPVLDQFRRIDSLLEAKYTLDFNMFLQGHFDSYQMFMRVIKDKIITNGKQLMTTFFFFVPRSVWPEKSIGSGSLVANKLGLSFTNISMNFFGEGYINFGYFGIVLFIIILAVINSKFDKFYWDTNMGTNLFSIFYFFLLGLEFFVLRGDLLSSFSFTIGIFFSVIFVQKICTKNTIYKKVNR